MDKINNTVVAETLTKLGPYEYAPQENRANDKKQAIYLAGPDVFEKDAIEIGLRMNQLCADHGFKGLYPLDNQIKLSGTQVNKARAIFEANVDLIKQADFVIANLNTFRGKEPDSGTAWECGYARALGKDVYIYLKDTRTCIEKYAEGELTYDEKLETHLYNDTVVEDFELPLNLMMACSNRGIIKGCFEDVLKVIAKDKKQKVETAEYVYDGEWQVCPQVRSGKGHCIWKDGQTYEGYWRNDKPEGQGRMIYADGSHFIGNWMNGEQQGRGVHTWTDGANYNGEWSEGKKDGSGELTFPDGAQYIGEYVASKERGFANFTLKDGIEEAEEAGEKDRIIR